MSFPANEVPHGGYGSSQQVFSFEVESKEEGQKKEKNKLREFFGNKLTTIKLFFGTKKSMNQPLNSYFRETLSNKKKEFHYGTCDEDSKKIELNKKELEELRAFFKG